MESNKLPRLYAADGMGDISDMTFSRSFSVGIKYHAATQNSSIVTIQSQCLICLMVFETLKGRNIIIYHDIYCISIVFQ